MRLYRLAAIGLLLTVGPTLLISILDAKGPFAPQANAPFGAKQALTYQQETAKVTNTEVEVVNSIGMRFRLIPAGNYLMGSPSSEIGRDALREKQQPARIETPFYLGKCEVTQGGLEESGLFISLAVETRNPLQC